MRKTLLFCFPYAGGSSTIFTQWKNHLDPRIELVAVELAGRGRRIHDPLYPDVPAMTQDVFSIVKDRIRQERYALFGHSMGSIIAYELVRMIRTHRLPLPQHIFFSGRMAPGISDTRQKKYHLMNNEEFRTAVIELGGTPGEFFEHPELLELFLPMLKNDFRLAEEKGSAGPLQPLDGDITVFLGKEEDLTPEQCDGWKKHVRGICSIHYFEGGHFFLHNATARLIKIINNTLLT